MFRVSGAMAVGQEGSHRLWGELSSAYYETDSGSDRGDSSSWINTGTLAGSSYIWRPWFALVSGGLSLSIAETDTTGQPTTTNEFITGNGRLDLFPRSRFPFSAYYSEGRNRFDDTVFRGDAETTKYGAMQSYRSLDGRHNYLAEYENNQSDSDDRNDFQSENLTFSALNRLGDHLLDSEIVLETVDNTTTGQEIDRYGLIVDHSLGDRRDFTIENLLSTFTTENDFFDFDSEVETTQLSSNVFWRPGGSRDLRLTGSLRLNETQVNDRIRGPVLSQRFERKTTSTNVSQGLIYQYSNNLQFSESVSATSTEFDGDQVSTFNEFLNARYISDPVITDYGDYAWNASTAFSNFHGDIESRQALSNQFGHSLTKTYARENRYQLQTSLNQSFSYIYLTENSDEKVVDHSYSMTWSDASIQTQNTIRFFISDSRTLNEDEDYFQVADLQYTGTNRLSRYSQLSGNMSLQFSRQKFERLQSEETSVNGQLSYRRIQVFQVPGLTFFSELQASRLEFEREQVSQTIDTDTNVLWENTLLYNIGRLEVSVELDYVKVRDEYDQLFKFEITRSFGDL
jgi:hypothetical protein